MYVLGIYTISISITQKEHSLKAFNHKMWLLQVNKFWKEKTLWKVNFWYQWINQFNTDSCCYYMAGDVDISSCGCVSLLIPECAMYRCVYVCETHTKNVLVLGYQGSTLIHNIIKWNNTSNVARSPIQLKKQDLKNSSGDEGWRQQEREVGQNFKRWYRHYRGVFITYGMLGTLCQLWPIKGCSGKRMFW